MDSQSIVALTALILGIFGYGISYYIKSNTKESEKLESKIDEMSSQLVVILEKITSIQINSAVYAKELDIIKTRVDNIDRELQTLKTRCVGRHGNGSSWD